MDVQWSESFGDKAVVPIVEVGQFICQLYISVSNNCTINSLSYNSVTTQSTSKS